MNQPTLSRALSFFDVSMLSAASMGPAYSLASTMGPMVAIAGAGAPLSLVLVTLCMGCIACSYNALSHRFPAAGSAYSWSYRAFGRYAGAFIAWVLMVANVFAILATAIPAGTYTLDLLAPSHADSIMWVALVSVLWVIISGVLLAAGVRPTAGVTAYLLIAEVVVLGLSALFARLQHPIATIASQGSIHVGAVGVLGAMILGLWMIDGWELSAATSEEATHERAAGHGGIVALVFMSVTLFVCMSGYLHLLGPGAFSGREADAMTVVGTGLGGWWRILIVVTVLISTSASLWTTMLYLTRSLYAMGRDGIIWPILAVLHTDATPRRALLFVTIVSALLTALSGISPSVSDALTLALSGSGVFLGLLFVSSAAAAIKLIAHRAVRLVSMIGLLGIACAIIAELAMPANTALRWSSLLGLALGCGFAYWRGREGNACQHW